MKPKLGPNLHLLAALTIATTALATVHMITFVWLTAFVYHDNIRGYVPAGFTGMFILAIASPIIFIYLAIVRRRYKKKASGYFLVGCLSVPLSVLLCSVYTGALLSILKLQYSLKIDVVITSLGAIFFSSIAITLHLLYMKKKTDNQEVHRIQKGSK